MQHHVKKDGWKARDFTGQLGCIDCFVRLAPLAVALETALAERPRTPGAHEAEQARIVAAAFARPGLALAAVRHDVPRLAAAVAAAREQVPLRR